MKHVNRITRADGTVQLFLRCKGLPSARLPDGLPPAELEAHVARLIRRLSGAPRPPPPALKAAIRAYELESPDFKGLAASTKYEYRRILYELDDDLGAVAIAAFTPAYVNRLKGLWARRGHRAANLRLQILKNVLKACLIEGSLKLDPFPLVGQVRRPRSLGEPHLVWSDPVFEAVMRAALEAGRFGLARAVAIARYTGARRGDLVVVPRSARQDGRIRFISGKRKVRVDLVEDPRLTDWLSRTPDVAPPRARAGRKVRAGETQVATTTLVYNLAGRPYTEDGLGQELAKLIDALHAAGVIDSNRYDLHGLRHTRGVELATAECTDAMGAAQMGHQSPHSFVQYRRQADRIRLSDAATALLSRQRERAQNENCNRKVQHKAFKASENEKGPGIIPVLSRPCDGTALPDRTGDLQSHNLAL